VFFKKSINNQPSRHEVAMNDLHVLLRVIAPLWRKGRGTDYVR
jgi:hypothetical protein